MEDSPPTCLLTFRQAAKSLGVTERTIYNYVIRGQLTAIKLGRLRRIHPDDLAAFITARREVRREK